MSQEGIYLYCFARAGVCADLHVHGVDGAAPIKAIETGPVAAIYSHAPLELFQAPQGESDRDADPARVVQHACRHQAVVGEIMKRSPVLPVRFGAVFSSTEALARVLSGNCRQIERFIEEVSNKEEWSVKGFMDAQRTALWLQDHHPDFSPPDAATPQSPGARYLASRKRGREASNMARHWCQSLAQQLGERLRELAVDCRELKAQPPAITGKREEMVLNCACLLVREAVPELRALAEQLHAECSPQGLDIEVSGPWPPYSFCPAIEWKSQ
jgi:hypothetical protein